MLRKILISILIIGMISYTFYSAYEKKVNEKKIAKQQNKIVETATQASLKVGERAPSFTLPDKNGHEISLERYEGSIVILNFWATWCPPCKEEIPDLVSFKNEIPSNVEIISINLTHSEKTSEQNIQQFIKDYQINFPVLFDKEGEVTDVYKVISVPTTFIINTKGIIVKRHIGPLTKKDLNTIIKKID